MRIALSTENRAVQAVVAELAKRVPTGEVVVDGPEYDRVVRVWNGAVTARPAAVVLCRTALDVQASVRVARDHGVPLSVRSGGHDAAGRGLADGGVTLDLSGLHSVAVNAAERSATVGGGTTAQQLVTAAERYGLSAVTGVAGSVGIAGLTLTGGYGPLAGRLGIAADNLLAADVVLADGSLVTTDADTRPDLFWALRGGGGNFGVVTAIKVRLHGMGPLLTGSVVYPLTQAESVLGGLGELVQDVPDELSVNSAIVTGPGGHPAVVLTPTWSGEAGGDDALQALTRLGNPVAARISRTTHSEALAAFDTAFPGGAPALLRTRNLPGLDAAAVGALIEAGRTFTTPRSVVLLSHFHGAAARVPAAATPFAPRTPHLMAQVIAEWGQGEDSSAHRRWADEVSSSLAVSALPGGYVAHLGADTPDQVAHAYGENAARLRQVKQAIDPDGVFRSAPIPAV